MFCRPALLGLAAALAFPSPAAAPPAALAGLRLTLLGTAGGPPPHLDQSQPASLLQVDGRSYLIDAGENAGQQLLRAGLSPDRVDEVFITHLHWDHTLGLGYLMASAWMLGRTQPLPLWGPAGLKAYADREEAALGIGEEIFRPQMPQRPPLSSLYPVRELGPATTQEVMRDGVTRVAAAVTTHYGLNGGGSHAYGPDRAYAYRFDTPAGSVTFTGDTGPSDAVTALARGSDVLVSEICDLDSIRAAMARAMGPAADLEPLMAHMRQEHLTPEAVGRQATAAGVRKLVLTHYVVGRGVDPQSMADKVRPFFKGEIVAGRDLQVIALPPR